MKATTLDLRRKMPDIVRALQRGEEVSVTHRGKPLARMVPDAKRNGTRVDLRSTPMFGMWADREDMKDPAEWVRKQRSKRKEYLRSIREAPLPKRGKRAV